MLTLMLPCIFPVRRVVTQFPAFACITTSNGTHSFQGISFSSRYMPKRKIYNRDLLRHLIDDEAGAPREGSDIDDIFDSTEDDEDATSSVDDDLF